MRRWCIISICAVVAALAAPLVASSAADAAVVPQSQVVSANPANYTPNVLDGDVESIAQVGNLIVLGGSFTKVSNSAGTLTYTRNNAVAFDATTGVISTTFNPAPNGTVTTVIPAADGKSVYLGGNFSTVSGDTRKKVAEVNVTTGANVAGFRNVAANAIVKDLRLVDGRLWVAGAFTSISGSAQAKLATLNATTGNADGYMGLAITGTHNNGTSQVTKIDVDSSGEHLVGIGNFTTVDSQSREQIFMLDTSGSSATLANWETDFYKEQCASVFNTYMRDLDFSPDGSYFIVTTTGAYHGATSACDTQARYNMSHTGTGITADWLETTGGDTTYAVEATGSAVYVGGHMRWENNPYAGDSPGAGAVAREGIAALDPLNGMPFSWNPGRTRGVGVFDMLSTTTGLWVASDTDRIGGEYHGRIAFFPLSGGTTVAATKTSALPATVTMLSPKADESDSPVLYRINAGGPAIASADGGPDWAADQDTTSPYRVGGTNIATYTGAVATDGTVPSTTPLAVFNEERWDDTGSPEMQWSFPVTAGTPIQVRLYFANRYSGTSTVGTRVFNVSLDGTQVLNNFDIVAAAGGTDIGTMKSFNIVSDGTVNIDFGHVTENPLVNAIEIVRTDVAGTTTDTTSTVRMTAFTGTEATASVDHVGDVDWTGVRGAFMLNGTVYLAYTDGSFVRRTFDGAQWGKAVDVDAQDQIINLAAWHADASDMTGLFYDNGRMYYTQSGDGTLRMRYFTPQNDVVGSAEYAISTSITGFDLADARGMFRAGEYVFIVEADGSLLRVGWSDGAFDAGSATVVSGPAVDGANWRSLAPFVYQSADGSQPNYPPTAKASATCDNQTCTFSSSGSGEVGGTITGYKWDFGDSTTSTAANPTHVYTASGTYNVTLTVTDANGVTAQTAISQQVTFVDTPPTASFTVTCDDQRACSFDASASKDTGGSITAYAWDFGDGANGTGVKPSHTYAADDSYTVKLTVTDSSNQTDVATKSVAVTYVYSDPVASFTVDCTSLTCTFDGSASSDADGPIAGYAWDFGDGTTSTAGAEVEHTYTAGGTFDASLTVTDGQSATDKATKSITVSELTQKISFVGSDSANRNSATHPVKVPAATEAGDVMVLLYTNNSTAVTVTAPSGWTEVAADQITAGGVTGRVWVKVAGASDAGSTVTPTASGLTKANATLLVYRGVDATAPVAAVETEFETVNRVTHTTPTITGVQNGLLVSYWGEKVNSSDTITASSDVDSRQSSSGSGNGNISSVAGDFAPLTAGQTGGIVATGGESTHKAFLVSLVLQPAN